MGELMTEYSVGSAGYYLGDERRAEAPNSAGTILVTPGMQIVLGTIDSRQRVFLMGIRMALITALDVLEDYLCLPRSIPSKSERRRLSGH